MKKILSYLSVFLMAFSLSVPVLASEATHIYKIDSSTSKPFEITLINREIMSNGRVDVYSFYIPDDGDYYEIPDFCDKYEDDAHITIQGTWNPTYARLNVMLKELDFGSSVYSYVDCNEAATYGLWHHSEWDCFLKADGKDISGTITIEVT